MKLFGLHEVAFHLSVDGYQFPTLREQDWDSNWLVVRGVISYPGGGWTFCEPCLTTFDVRELADWLDAVAAGQPAAPRCAFDEPNLIFEYLPPPQAAVVIRFARHCAPTWHGSEERLASFDLSFDAVLNDFAAAASDLRALLVVFPERGLGSDSGTQVRH